MSLCNKKYYNFVIVGTLESESKEAALKFLENLMKAKEINDLVLLIFLGKFKNNNKIFNLYSHHKFSYR